MISQKGCSWLPDLVLNPGSWEEYVEILYKYYIEDFVNNKPTFRGQKLSVKRHPEIDGKDITFWHIISEGKDPDNRVPNFRRCEKIRWPKPIIEHEHEPDIKVWQNRRKNEQRICIWFEDQEYLVVLAKRTTYILFWTAYPVTRNHTKQKLKKEYQGYIKRLAPPF
jgi:hypothetical protein